MQERRLARAAGPDERGELPGVETQIDAVEGDHFLSPPSEPLPDPLEPQQAHVSLFSARDANPAVNVGTSEE